jgi:hypothetical protein
MLRHRRTAVHARPRETDILVTRHKPYQVYLNRAKKLLGKDQVSSIKVSGTGAALVIAVQVALEVQRLFGASVILHPQTNSRIVMDEVEHHVSTKSYHH